MTHPILYSFRRCPYAMRARLAIASSGIQVELREIILRDKAPEFLETSPTATVPCLKINERIIDESLHIMAWALGKNDPETLMQMPTEGYSLMSTCDGPFKQSLDRYKYPNRYDDVDEIEHREAACSFLESLEAELPSGHLSDAIFPFVRQFANHNRDWFDKQPWPKVHSWLSLQLNSEEFGVCMKKHKQWMPDK